MENSLLVRLPPELRNDIYELLFTLAKPVKMRLKGRNGKSVLRAKNDLGATGQALALTRTCRAIHDESAALFYATNTFYIESAVISRSFKMYDYTNAVLGVEEWMRVRQHHHQEPKHVELDLGTWVPWIDGYTAEDSAQIARRFEQALHHAQLQLVVSLRLEDQAPERDMTVLLPLPQLRNGIWKASAVRDRMKENRHRPKIWTIMKRLIELLVLDQEEAGGPCDTDSSAEGI